MALGLSDDLVDYDYRRIGNDVLFSQKKMVLIGLEN